MNKSHFDIKPLKDFIEKGQLLLLEEEKGKIKYRRCAMMVNTTIDKAWNVLSDFKRYPNFIPGVEKITIIDEFEDEATVKFVVGVKFMGIGGTVKYTLKYIFEKPKLEFTDPDTKERIGYWEIIPIDDKKIILFYYDEAPDVKTIHPIVRFSIQKIPLIEIAFYVAPVSILVKAMKNHMEKK